ncbi:MAG: hypothetical protein ACPGOV_08575 [Magnetovibrionaceae bacterium]
MTTTRNSKRPRWLWLILALGLGFGVSYAWAQTGNQIQLGTPASFPVDI